MTAGLVAGRFHLRRLLGSGGTASVFEADDTLTGTRVALKLLHAHLANAPDASDAFLEEMRAARAITHPNLAQIYDAGIDRHDPPVVWIAMELVTGVSLADHVREQGPLDVADAVVIAQTVLDALAAVHAAGVVHRDVTPANIMFDPGRRTTDAAPDAFAHGIRLLDFGLADVPGRTTRGGDALLSATPSAADGVVASVPYASPEQLTGEAVDEPSDLYQLAATLYFALTGQAPFAGDVASVVRAHLSAPPPVASARRREIPRELDRAIATAMLKRPADRFADAADMRRALDAARTAPTRPDAPTALTRVYRTTVPDPATVTSLSSPLPSPTVTPTPSPSPSPARGSWRAPVIAALIIAATTAVAGWSAMAASPAPVPTPRTAPVTSTPTVTPSVTPSPSTAFARVPEIGTLSLPEARQALERAGFVVEVLAEDGPEPADTVHGTTPPAGESLAVGATIQLRAASGRNAVPAVAGLSLAEAQRALAAAGFSSRVEGGPAAGTEIVAMSLPAAGPSTPVGTVVVLQLSAAEPRTPTPSPTPSPTPTPTPVTTPPPTPAPTGGGRP